MDLAFTDEENAFRIDVRAFIKENLPLHIHKKMVEGRSVAKEDIVAWQRILNSKGWATPSWPKAWGGPGWTAIQRYIFLDELHQAPAPEPLSFNVSMIGPVIATFGTDAQKERFLPRIANIDDWWCQGFSEPGAGSDLAGVRTRAERYEGGWRLNGQKVWTSGAHHSEWGIALVRTDPDAVKHKGLTMFIVNISTPGVTVRPIEQLSGSTHFNEVFFDDVLLPDEQRLGEANDGWRVALTTLMSERMSIGASTPTGIDEIFELALQRSDDGTAPIESEDVRLRLADWYAKSSGIRFGVYRMLTALARGGSPGPEAAVCKLVGATTTQDIAAYGLDLLGARGRAASGDEDAWQFHTLFAFGAVHRLEGGTDEVLRNILAERVLGLPADIRVDRGPFRDIPTAPRPGA